MMGFIIPSDLPAFQKMNFDIDLEIGSKPIFIEKEGSNDDFSPIEKASNHQITLQSDFSLPSSDRQLLRDLSRADDCPSDNRKNSGERCLFGEERVKVLDAKVGKEISREKAPRKPSKPPRPPKSLQLDAADRKVAKEMSEVAALKRLRAERIKSLRSMKNANTGFNCSNFCALLVTVLFCIIIIHHGISWKRLLLVKVDSSPESSQ